MQSKNRQLREVTMNSAAAPGIDAGRRRRQPPAEVSAFVGEHWLNQVLDRCPRPSPARAIVLAVRG